MEQHFIVNQTLFPHIRIVLGIVIGFGITRLLSGVARIMQHPDRHALFGTHLAWTAWVLLELIYFWWWEFNLYTVPVWTFGTYAFVISYAILLFLLCALLFPESMQDYVSYRDYFLTRRGWFFGVLAASYLFDVVDTLIKGRAYFGYPTPEYIINTLVVIALCMVAIKTRNARFHAIFVTAMLIYQVSWILRRYGTLM